MQEFHINASLKLHL